jgi:hypothetical protein
MGVRGPHASSAVLTDTVSTRRAKSAQRIGIASGRTRNVRRAGDRFPRVRGLVAEAPTKETE